MAGRLLDSRAAFLVAAPIALPLGYVAAMWPLYALAGVGVVILLLLAVLRVEALLLVLAAALPWEGLLAYPTESVSVVKILGVLLFGAWLVRALARSEPLRVSPALAWAAALGLAVGLSVLFAPDPAESVFDALRYALFITFFFLVLQLDPHARGRAQDGARRRALEHARRRLGAVRVRRAQPRAGRGPDRGPERLRLPDVLRASARLLPARRGEAPPSPVVRLLPAAARRHARDPVARRARRAERARAVGDRDPPRPGDAASCSGLRPCSASRAIAFALWAPLLQRPARAEEQRRGQERRGAPGAVARGAADGRGPAAHRRGTGPLPHRGAVLCAQQPARHREAGRPQLLPPRAGGDGGVRADRLRRLPRLVVAPARARQTAGGRRRRSQRTEARDRHAGLAARRDRRRRVPERAVHDAVLADRSARHRRGRRAASRPSEDVAPRLACSGATATA